MNTTLIKLTLPKQNQRSINYTFVNPAYISHIFSSNWGGEPVTTINLVNTTIPVHVTETIHEVIDILSDCCDIIEI